MTKTPIPAARALLNSKAAAVLSTLSVKLGGYPFGSLVPYCLDGRGRPVVLVSGLAEHTRNMVDDNRCSLTVAATENAVQANARLCIVGRMETLEGDEKEVRERYHRHFPESRSYIEMLDFSFYRLIPSAVRYIAGFAAIHWLEPKEVFVDNPFHAKGEERIVAHMNEDHRDALVRYCQHHKQLQMENTDVVRMVGIDSEGFDVFVNERKVRFDFTTPVRNAGEARAALVELSQETDL